MTHTSGALFEFLSLPYSWDVILPNSKWPPYIQTQWGPFVFILVHIYTVFDIVNISFLLESFLFWLPLCQTLLLLYHFQLHSQSPSWTYFLDTSEMFMFPNVPSFGHFLGVTIRGTSNLYLLTIWWQLKYIPKLDFCLKIHIQQVRHHHLYTFSVLQTKHIKNQNDDLFTPKSEWFILFGDPIIPIQSSKLYSSWLSPHESKTVLLVSSKN